LYNAIGGLIFLRFIIPSIFAPNYYGLTKEPPTPTLQRNLILLSKVIQSIANMVLPGNKEPFMTSMHGYIDRKIPIVKTFFDHISNANNNAEDAEMIKIPKSMRNNAIGTLWNLFFSKAEQVKAKLRETGNNGHIQQVDELLSKYPERAGKI